MRQSKLIVLIMILAIFISNSVGVIIIFNQIKNYHKRTIKNLISKNSFNQVIEQLSFSKNDLKQGKYKLKFIDEHEFKFNEKMYDVLSKWETEDSVFYRCINDTKEEEIEKAFVEFVVNNDRQDLPLPIKQLLTFLNLELFNISGHQNPFIQEIKFYKQDFSENILENLKDIPVPPPRFQIF